jgi:hypothetical protein
LLIDELILPDKLLIQYFSFARRFSIMNGRFLIAAVGPLLAIGFGLGFGLAVSGKSFVLEGHGTPIGSFVLRCNTPQTGPLDSSPSKEQTWLLWGSEIA